MMEKKTPLYESHVALGAKMVEFGGFLMPVQYPTGILAEHMAVREKAGLFDVSHMGELVFHGEDALENIQHLVTTDISKMLDGDMRYGMFCNDEGGVVDDLIVYRMAQDDYLIVVNAGNRDKDAAWVETHLSGHPGYHDAGNEFGQIAVQGPVSKEILVKLCDEAELPVKYYSFTKAAEAALMMATVCGAKAQGREKECGQIKLGMDADLILLDFTQPHLIPCHNVLSNLVYAASGHDVVLTMVRGQILYNAGKFPTLDLAGALKELHDYAIPKVFSDDEEAPK